MKKGIIIFASLVIIIACFLIVAVLSSLKQTLPPPNIATIPTPTSVPPPLQNYSGVTISNVSPSNTDIGVSIFATISATFSRPLTNAEKYYAHITLSPSISGSTTWNIQNQTINFMPSQLALGQTYTVTLLYGKQTFTWSFTTATNDSLSQSDSDRLQLQADDNFSSWQRNLYTSYPWYDSLPLQGDNYFTYFDTQQKAFITSIYSNDPNTISQIKRTIQNQLTNIGVVIKNYKFQWISSPGSE